MEKKKHYYYAATSEYGNCSWSSICGHAWNYYAFDTEGERDKFVNRMEQYAPNIDFCVKKLDNNDIAEAARENGCTLSELFHLNDEMDDMM